jgi:hypothetical protein
MYYMYFNCIECGAIISAVAWVPRSTMCTAFGMPWGFPSTQLEADICACGSCTAPLTQLTLKVTVAACFSPRGMRFAVSIVLGTQYPGCSCVLSLC